MKAVKKKLTAKVLLTCFTGAGVMYLLLNRHEMAHGKSIGDIFTGALGSATIACSGYLKRKHFYVFLAAFGIGVLFQWQSLTHGSSFKSVCSTCWVPATLITIGFMLLEYFRKEEPSPIDDTRETLLNYQSSARETQPTED